MYTYTTVKKFSRVLEESLFLLFMALITRKVLVSAEEILRLILMYFQILGPVESEES